MSEASSPSRDYLRHPAVLGDQLLVVADDDIWVADLGGGRALRLSDGHSPAAFPLPSPDGSWLAFTAREEDHPEIFTMPLSGGPGRRWSHLGGSACAPGAWQADGSLLVATNAELPFVRDSQLVVLDDSPSARATGWGSAHEVALDDDGRVLVGRNTTNRGRWKRYRGGTAGQLWLDADGSGTFRRLLDDLAGDLSCPMLIGRRCWFISDHEGVGNLYSCDLEGQDLRRHTHHNDFYARFAQTDGSTVVYAAGGDIYRLSPTSGDAPRPVDVHLASPRAHRARRFVDPARWLQDYTVHPKGTHVGLRVRGRPFSMPLFDGPVRQVGVRDGVNHRLLEWLADGERMVLLSDNGGEERLEVHHADGSVQRWESLDLGVVLHLAVCPTADVIALTDQQGRLRTVSLAAGPDGEAAVQEVAASPFGVDDPAWSPDGRWLAWSHRESNWHTASIRVHDTELAQTHAATDGRFLHRKPAWDPEGRFLYWVAASRLVPAVDGVYFDHGFPLPDVLMAAVLAEDGRAPLELDPHPPGRPPKPGEDEGPGPADGEGARSAGGATAPPVPVTVDVDGLAERVVRLPFPTGRYRAVTGLRGKVLALSVPLRPEPLGPQPAKDRKPPGQLEVMSLVTGKHEVLVSGVSSYAVSQDASTMVYAVRRRLRAVAAGGKPPEGPAGEGPARVSGWLDLGRLTVSVSPALEWRQMFDEAWRLQRELFWHETMSGVDWSAVHDRYRALVDRIATRSELSDLIWEMFGELGTGHAYERGGDLPAPPPAPLGRLGADLEWDGTSWVIRRILQGEVAVRSRRMPLRAPGVRVGEGARLLAVDGVALDETTHPAELLVNRADAPVVLRVADPAERDVTVRTLRGDTDLRYSDWVARNRAQVRTRSDHRVGYIHIPDMGAHGFAEFHRQYLAEANADALVVDVRFNGGGNVSSLLLEKLSGVRIGYQLRRTGAVEPIPHHAPAGPLVAITNERCGSDGDIFTHSWKRLDLGPVVGTRTWGGVIGIQPRHTSVDGTVTTQPAFATWFDDVGFGVENYGTDPTHPREVAPHETVDGSDPQLDLAVDLALEALATRPPPPLPDPAEAPDLAAPGLPEPPTP